MVFERSVMPVILSLAWSAAAIFGAWCCVYAIWMTLKKIYDTFTG